MWPLSKRQKQAKAASQQARPSLRMVDPKRSEYQTHREFVGEIGISMNGLLAMNEFSLNKSYRHCRIGKIVLKSA